MIWTEAILPLAVLATGGTALVAMAWTMARVMAARSNADVRRSRAAIGALESELAPRERATTLGVLDGSAARAAGKVVAQPG